MGIPIRLHFLFLSILSILITIKASDVINSPIWPLSEEPIHLVPFPCDACQMLCDITSNAMLAYKKKKGMSKKGMLDVAVTEIADANFLCSYSYWATLADKVPGYGVEDLILHCKKTLGEHEESFEKFLTHHYENSTKLSEVFCIPNYCETLWKENEIIGQRESKSERKLRYAKEFLAYNEQQADIKVTKSGLQYKIIKAVEDGESPVNEDKVKVYYEGKLLSGEVFDSNLTKDTPSKFGLNAVIPGWTEGLKMMKIGEIFEFYIPPDLGYGKTGSGPSIGPNELLIFHVELVNIIPTPNDEEL